jgi:two-component system, NarL family, sensor histidine kinase UhpB
MFKTWMYISLLLCFHQNISAQVYDVDSLLSLLPGAKEDTGKVNLYRNLAGSLKFTNPSKAIEYARKGIALSKILDFEKGSAGCYLNLSTAYTFSDKLDTALIYLDTALQYAHKVGDPNRLGLAYLNRADIYRQQQNFTQSLKDCDTALQYANQANNDDVRARVTQTIGSVFYQQEIYPQSIIYHEKAIALYRKTGNLRMQAIVNNNLGLNYKSIKQFEKAIAVTTEAIRITDSLKDISNQSLFNGNLSDAYYEMGNYTQAEKYAGLAMKYAIMQNNQKQMALAWEITGNVYLKQKRVAEALSVLNKAMPVFKQLDATDRINTIADALAEAYSLAGNYTKAYEYMRIAQVTNDSLVKWKYDDEIAAMQTKFKVGEKDKEILLLNKDKELQQEKLQKQNLLIISTTAFTILALIGVWLLINRSRLKQRMKLLEIRGKIAADLHDEVGSTLSSIRMYSDIVKNQANQTETAVGLLEKISSNSKEMIENMSDIVWMIKPGNDEMESIENRLLNFANELCSPAGINFEFIKDEAADAIPISMEKRRDIYLIFKEAITNVVKYSGCNSIHAAITLQNHQLEMRICDDGNGFDTTAVKKGNGLFNMQKRAMLHKGTCNIQSVIGEGTKIIVCFPV